MSAAAPAGAVTIGATVLRVGYTGVPAVFKVVGLNSETGKARLQQTRKGKPVNRAVVVKLTNIGASIAAKTTYYLPDRLGA